ncbi:hypothetical protein ACW2Q0_18385 [Nocardia sp. R16R-3T]
MTNSATKPAHETAAQQEPTGSSEHEQQPAGDGMRVPVPTVGIHMAHVPGIPAPKSMASKVTHSVSSMGDSVRHRVPDTEPTLLYGGLGAAAVFGLLEWPVAAAVGAGVWVATRARRRDVSST